jgi:predicted O-methyltransferase YrrM
MMEPKLRPGGLVLADNIRTFPAEIKAYVEFMARPGGPYRSVTLPFESGLHFSLYTGT